MSQQSIERAVYNAYSKKGFGAACDVANKHNVPYEYCKACENSTPAYDNTCLLCGQATTPEPANIRFYPDNIDGPWDEIEVHPICEVAPGVCDVCENHEADYYSVYLHKIYGGVMCVADVPNLKLAKDLYDLLDNASKKRVYS